MADENIGKIIVHPHLTEQTKTEPIEKGFLVNYHLIS